jgi:hypothetical protein
MLNDETVYASRTGFYEVLEQKSVTGRGDKLRIVTLKKESIFKIHGANETKCGLDAAMTMRRQYYQRLELPGRMKKTVVEPPFGRV